MQISAFRPSFYALAITVAVLSGCTESLIQSEAGDSQASPPVITGKLVNGHLLGQATSIGFRADSIKTVDSSSITDGADQPTTDEESRETVSLLIATNEESEDPTLTSTKILRRYKLLRRYSFTHTFTGVAVEVYKDSLAAIVQRMEEDPDIKWVQPDILLKLVVQDVNSVTLFQKLPWGVKRIGGNVSSTASGNLRGSVGGVNLFIIDSGLEPYDVNVSLERIENYSSSLHGLDLHGHGLHVAATAGAKDDLLGIVGVAPGVRTWSLKVLDDLGETQMSTVIWALERVMEIQKSYPGTPAVVNISLGGDVGTTAYTPLDDAVDAAVAAGITVVVAAGNEGIDASTVTPAHARGAITVGAYDKNDQFAWFSNYGPTVDLLAPGVDILSLGGVGLTMITGVEMSGTSMAAPHVSGAAALYLSNNPTATPQQVKQKLIQDARPDIAGTPAGTTNKTVWVAGY